MVYSNKNLEEKGLKEVFRIIFLYIQEHGSISNSIVDEICEVSKATATRYLDELKKKIHY